MTYAHEYKEPKDYMVGYKNGDDFEVIKTFDTWEKAWEFFLQKLQEDIFRKPLYIRDNIHKIDSTVKIYEENFYELV